LTLILVLASPAHSQDAKPRVRASVNPGKAHVGEPVIYRGIVVLPRGSKPRWLPPEKIEALTWGTPRPALRTGAADTLSIEIPVQAFQLGAITIPGLRFEEPRLEGVQRLPGVTLEVQPVLTPADSNAELRPARGPLPAPWWERVPWLWVVYGILALVLIVALVRWWRARRRRGPAAVPVPVLDPAARALEALAALRARNLPAGGRFAEHAFELTQLLRRYLEEVTYVPRPGHTTPELVEVLRRTRIDAEDLHRLQGLLRTWDRVKFARATTNVEESVRAEEAVERLVRHLAAPAEARAA
jgi:hypothetical protein